jgi:hypothetical protein
MNRIVRIKLIDSSQLVCVPDLVVANPQDTIQWITEEQDGKHHGGFDVVSPLKGLDDRAEWDPAVATVKFEVKSVFGSFKYHVTLDFTQGEHAGESFYTDPKVVVDRPQ